MFVIEFWHVCTYATAPGRYEIPFCVLMCDYICTGKSCESSVSTKLNQASKIRANTQEISI
jgi:hypothetical protein